MNWAVWIRCLKILGLCLILQRRLIDVILSVVIINEVFSLTFRSSLSPSITMVIVLSDLTYISKPEKRERERMTEREVKI